MVDQIQPATGPSVWTGRDLIDTKDWIIPLAPEDIQELETALAAVQRRKTPVHEITADDFPLHGLGKTLKSLAGNLEHGRGFGVLRGYPVDQHDEEALKIVSWGLCSYFGAGIPQSREGDWINHVMDVSDLAETSRPDLQHIVSRGQLRTNHIGGELDFHTDTTDIFALFCLRNARKGGVSRLVSAATLHNLILAEKPNYLKALYDGYYYMSQGVDTENSAPRVSTKRVPVFTRKGNTVQGYYISQVVQRAIDLGGVTYNPVEDDARAEIQRVAERPGIAHEFLLQPGDLLVANNRAVLHARDDYEDYPELDRRRHLFRLWLATTPDMMANTFKAPSDRFSDSASP